MREEAVSGIPATTNTEPASSPSTTKVDPVSNKDNGSSSKMKANRASLCCSKTPSVDMDKDAPLPSKSPRINRAAPVPQKSSLVDKATSGRPKSPPLDKATPVPPKSPPLDKATLVHPKSPASDKATLVHPKSPAVDKATPVRPKSPAIDKATPVRPKSPVVDKATPVRPKSPAVDKATPVHPKSPAVDKATPIPPKSPPVDKASPAPPKSLTGTKDVSLPSRSPQIDKSVPAPPRLPQVDKAAMPSLELPQTCPAANSEAQEETTSVKVTATSVPEVAVAASRPSSAPVFPTPRSTAPATSRIHVSTLLSRSMSEAAGRSVNDPSPSAPPYVPQTYRNAIVGKPGLGTTSASVAYQSTSLGQDTTPSQPLSAYASSTAIMMPPSGRSDQLSARFKSGLGKLEAHDSWQMWKGDSNVDKHLWRDHTPYQQTASSQAYEQPQRGDTYQQASSRGTEKLSRYGGLQSRRFQSERTIGHAWHQPQRPVAEEFPHLDIINDLLEEDHCNGSMPESFRQDYQAFGLPFLPRGNLADLEMAFVSSPGRFNSIGRYYDEGSSRAYDMSALQGMRERQFTSMGTYSNGLSDMSASKPWLNGSPNPAMSLGVGTNGYPHQVGDYTNLGSGVNGVSLWRCHANGRW
uniref:TRAF-like superfamily protein n=1 Tax=Arundo donax TaxID=35708 RepID=A0A0A8Z701_ARUDO